MIKSLKSRNDQLADTHYQVKLLSEDAGSNREYFSAKLRQSGLFPLQTRPLEIFQVNVGKMCNQVCKHCHVDAGPDRKEIMTRETMQQCLDALALTTAHTVDITGGAPEMNPDFRWFVEQLSAMNRKIIVRCNLTIIVANAKYNDLPDFFRKHNVEVVSSLPYFNASRTDSQRGEGVFEKSIRALKMLNETGYGVADSGLVLNLVYNPSGAFMPAEQSGLEREFKKRLFDGYGITFNSLFAITNIPVSRFLDYLVSSGNYDAYMDKLVSAYNPVAAAGVMCRNTLSVGWDGYLYDCDFNQMLDLKVAAPGAQHVSDFQAEKLQQRHIIVNQHCYGCTAGAGSSCGGTVA